MIQRRPDGKIPLTNVTNELADAVNRIPTPLTGLMEKGLGITNSFIGQIMPHGIKMTDDGPVDDPDFTDNRYWVRALCVGSTTIDDSTVDLEVDNSAVAGSDLDFNLINNVVEVTNLAEHYPYVERGKPRPGHEDEDPIEGQLYVGRGTHLLPHGTLIEFGPRIQNGTLDLPHRYVTFSVPRMTAMLKITDPAQGGGKYLGYEMIPATYDLNKDDNVGEADFGTPHTADSIIIFNPDEVGAATHSLMASPRRIFMGYFLMSRKDGKRVYALNPGQGGSLPPGTGRYKVLQLMDDLDPGTPGWDYIRFNNSSPL